jgi:hypothetical protein
MRKMLIASAAALGAMSAPAYAVPIVFYSSTFAFPATVTPVIFQTFGSGAADGTSYTPAGPTVVPPVSFSEAKTGTVLLNVGTVPGQFVDPTPGSGPTDNYLSVNNGSYTVSFAAPLQFFSFIAGTLDSYNSLTLNLAGGGLLSYTGSQLQAIAGAVPSFNSNVAGRFSFDMQGGAGIVSAVFSSSQAAFEVDGLAGAVPEPAAWGLMIVGFGAAGMALRVRRRKVTFATA